MKRAIRVLFAGIILGMLMLSPVFADLTSETYKTIFLPDGATTEFNFDFKVFDEDDLEVILVTEADGTETTLTLTTNYTVSGLSDSGGTVTTVSTYADTYTLIVRRNQALKQEIDYVPRGDFSTTVLEQGLDQMVMMIQDNQEELSRAVVRAGTETTQLVFPSATASKIIGWNAAGTALENVDSPLSVTVADTTDTTCFVALWESATGDLLPKSDAGITYNAGTANLATTTFTGALTGTASLATTLTITDNESTNENNAILFTSGGDLDGGDLGLECDGTAYYNPSTGTITATGFAGLLTGDVALTADADAGDYDWDSLDRLEFYDAGLYIDGGTDATLLISTDGTLQIATNDWDISTTGVQTGMGNITSDGTVEGATLTEGGVAVHNNDEMDASSELAAIIDDETGSSLIVFNTNPTFEDITLNAAGVKISDDADGQITFLGLGDGADEDFSINLDDTADTIVVASSTSANFDFGMNVDADALTEGGDAVYSSGETPGGSLGGTWASPTIDDLFIKLGGDAASAGVYDFGAASVVLEIPNAAAPTTDATGEMAIDTDLITQGMLQVYLASAIANVVATTDAPADNEIPTYDSGGGTIQWEAPAGGGGDVTSASSITEHSVVRGADGSKGVELSTAFITDSGELYNASQPSFLVQPSSAQSDMAKDGVTFAFGTEVFDIGTNFASNTFTAPVTGKYQLNAIISLSDLDSSAAYYNIRFIASNRTVMGVLYDFAQMSADAAQWGMSSSVVMDMDATDTVYIQFWQDGGTQQTDGNDNSSFSGMLIQ